MLPIEQHRKGVQPGSNCHNQPKPKDLRSSNGPTPLVPDRRIMAGETRPQTRNRRGTKVHYIIEPPTLPRNRNRSRSLTENKNNWRVRRPRAPPPQNLESNFKSLNTDEVMHMFDAVQSGILPDIEPSGHISPTRDTSSANLKKYHRLNRRNSLPYWVTQKLDDDCIRVIEIFESKGYMGHLAKKINWLRLGDFVTLWIRGFPLIQAEKMLRLDEYSNLVNAKLALQRGSPDKGTGMRRFLLQECLRRHLFPENLARSIKSATYPGKQVQAQGFWEDIVQAVTKSMGRKALEGASTSSWTFEAIKGYVSGLWESVTEKIKNALSAAADKMRVFSLSIISIIVAIVVIALIWYLSPYSRMVKTIMICTVVIIATGVCTSEIVYRIVESVIAAKTEAIARKTQTKMKAGKVIPESQSEPVDETVHISDSEADEEEQPTIEKVKIEFDEWRDKMSKAADAEIDKFKNFFKRPRTDDPPELKINETSPLLPVDSDDEATDGVTPPHCDVDAQGEGDDEDGKETLFATLKVFFLKHLFDKTTPVAKAAPVFNSFWTAAKNIKEFLTVIFSNLKAFIDWAYEAATGMPFFAESRHMRELWESLLSYDELLTHESVHEDLNKSPLLAKRVIESYEKILSMRSAVINSSLPVALQTHVANSLLKHHDVYIRAKQALRQHSNRTVPLWVYFRGVPGVGKTQLIQYFLSALYRLVEKDKFFPSMFYERKQDQIFWDGYANQWATSIDDVFQAKDKTSRMNTALNLIYMVNHCVFPLHMASLDAKDTTFFQSRVVVTTTNDEEDPANLGIVDARALYRRRHFCVELDCRDEFKVRGPDGNIKIVYPDKEFSTDDLANWIFRVSVGDKVHRLDFRSFVVMCAAKYKLLAKEAEIHTKGTSINWERFFSSTPDIAGQPDPTLQEQVRVERIIYELPEPDYASPDGVDDEPPPLTNRANLRRQLRNVTINHVPNVDIPDETLDQMISQKGEEILRSLQGDEEITLTWDPMTTAAPFRNAATTSTPSKTDVNAEGFVDVVRWISGTHPVQRLMREIRGATKPNAIRSAVQSFVETYGDVHDRYHLDNDIVFRALSAMYAQTENVRDHPVTGTWELACLTHKAWETTIPCTPKDVTLCRAVARKLGIPTPILVNSIYWIKIESARVIDGKYDFDLDPPGIPQDEWNEFYKALSPQELERVKTVLHEQAVYYLAQFHKWFSVGQVVGVVGLFLTGFLLTSGFIKLLMYAFRASTGIEVKAESDTKYQEKQAKKQLRKAMKKAPKRQVNAHAYDENAMSLIRRMDANVRYGRVLFADGLDRKIVLTFVKGQICATAHHVVHHPAEITEFIIYPSNLEEPEHALRIPRHQMEFKHYPERDLTYIWMKGVPAHKNLDRHIRSKKMPWNVITRPTRLAHDDDGTRWLQTGTKYEPAEKITTHWEDEGVSQSADLAGTFWARNCEGSPGQCGLPYVAFATAVSQKILGIHVAGYKNDSIIAPIYREDYEAFDVVAQMSVGEPLFMKGKELDIDYDVNFTETVKGTRLVAVLKKPFFAANESKLVPTIVQNGFYNVRENGQDFVKCPYPITRRPTALKAFRNKLGVYVNPMNVALARYAEKRRKPVLQDFDDRSVWKGLHPKGEFPFDLRPFTIEEAIHGIPEWGNFHSMETSTSAGPLAQGMKCSELFTHEPAWINPDFRDLVEREIKMVAEENCYPPCIGTDCLKDELRSVERVTNGETRIFVNVSKSHAVRCRMFLGAFFARMEKTPAQNDSTLGMNVFSNEWKMLFEALTKFGDESHFSCDDVKEWDMHMPYVASEKFDQEVILVCKADAFWARQIRACVRSALSCWHINGKIVYLGDWMPSGTLITAGLNTAWNSASNRVAYKRIVPVQFKEHYDSFVRTVFNGDDNARTVHDQIFRCYNTITFASFAKRYFDWEITNPDKSPTLKEECSVEEIEYLKRKFRREGPNVLCPLEPKTIQMMTCWVTRNDANSVEHQTMLNIHGAINEWFFHGKEKFEEQKEILNRFLYKLNPAWVYTREYSTIHALWVDNSYSQ